MSHLTLAKLSDIAGAQDLRYATALNIASKGIASLDDLSICVELRRIDLSHNEIASADAIDHCKSLTWLNAAHNKLTSLAAFRALTQLQVLNVSNNELTSMDTVQFLVKLKALVLNNNRISLMEHLEQLVELNTIVLSHNRLRNIRGLATLTKLTKLSIAHNEIRTIPDLRANHELAELRLNDNKIQALPETLELNMNIKILDLGNNLIKTFEAIDVLGKMPFLEQINLRGNGVIELEGYEAHIRKLVPKLKVLDGRKLEEARVADESRKKLARARALEQQAKKEKHIAAAARRRAKAAESDEEGSGDAAPMQVDEDAAPAAPRERREHQQPREPRESRGPREHSERPRPRRPASGDASEESGAAPARVSAKRRAEADEHDSTEVASRPSKPSNGKGHSEHRKPPQTGAKEEEHSTKRVRISASDDGSLSTTKSTRVTPAAPIVAAAVAAVAPEPAVKHTVAAQSGVVGIIDHSAKTKDNRAPAARPAKGKAAEKSSAFDPDALSGDGLFGSSSALGGWN